MNIYKHNKERLKILTPDGYKEFEGIRKISKNSCNIIFTSGKQFKCSLDHRLCVNLFDFQFEFAKNLKIGDKIFGNDGWYEIKDIVNIGIIDLYELVNVSDTICYYTEGLLSHNCEFINSGTSSINEQLYTELKKHLRDPIEVLMDGKYKIWEQPNPDHTYVGGVDVSEGVGGDFSVIKILDITDLTEIVEVAEYYDNTIPVAEFSNKVYEVLQHWGSPLVCIERNNQGGQVADRLGMDFGYNKIVNWGGKLAGRKSMELLGMISSRNTKYYACANARYFYSDKGAVVFRNDHSLEEVFKDFVKVNDTWQAISGKHDDRTMALIWALMILDKDLCERWFTIEEFDDYGKPLRITPLDFGIKYFENPTSIYSNEQIDRIENSMLNPVAFGGFGEADDELSALYADGWQLLGGSMPYIDPSRTMTQGQYDIMEKWFG